MLKVYDTQQFIEKAKTLNQIVCFGAGKRIEMLKRIFRGTEVWNKIHCIVDNDTKKQNTKIRVGEKTIEVLSLNQLKERKYNNYAILITCVQYTEVINQLDLDNILKNVDYCCLQHMRLLEIGDIEIQRAIQKKIPLDIKLYKEAQIPKVIHYCWFGGAPIPEQYKIWMDSWHKYCPDYDIVEWNESNYDITKNTYMHQAYENRKWGFVPDYARLDIIYNHGGIYLDTDVELVQSLEELLYQKGFAGFEDDKSVALGLGFGAVKGLPIIKSMMESYENMKFVNQDGSLNIVASPYIQTQVLMKHGLHADGEYQIVEDLTIYPEKMLSGKNWITRRVALQPYTRAIHHYAGSWLDKKDRENAEQFDKEMSLYHPSSLYK